MVNRPTPLVWCFVVFLLVSLLAVVDRPLVGAEEYNAVYGDGAHGLTVATGSPGELGLLEALAKSFNRKHDTTIRWKKAGSGKSLALLKERKVDVVLVHAPEAERKAVAAGWAERRTLIGSNQFYLIGPKEDPAGVSKAVSAVDAYARVARAKATFLSRGDNSGTHQKEMAIWKEAGIKPSGSWYVTTKDFMLATLRKANERKAYFMTDSSTWVSARAKLGRLGVLYQGDSVLVNVYHALCQPEGATDEHGYVSRFVDFLRGEEAQAIIRNYGRDRYGEPMYRDAKHARAYQRKEAGPGGRR
jgi:tungstate transport system substrate-binding protein